MSAATVIAAVAVVALGRAYDWPTPLEHQKTKKSDQDMPHFHLNS
jgi:hypothetical protein